MHPEIQKQLVQQRTRLVLFISLPITYGLRLQATKPGVSIHHQDPRLTIIQGLADARKPPPPLAPMHHIMTTMRAMRGDKRGPKRARACPGNQNSGFLVQHYQGSRTKTELRLPVNPQSSLRINPNFRPKIMRLISLGAERGHSARNLLGARFLESRHKHVLSLEAGSKHAHAPRLAVQASRRKRSITGSLGQRKRVVRCTPQLHTQTLFPSSATGGHHLRPEEREHTFNRITLEGCRPMPPHKQAILKTRSHSRRTLGPGSTCASHKSQSRPIPPSCARFRAPSFASPSASSLGTNPRCPDT